MAQTSEIIAPVVDGKLDYENPKASTTTSSKSEASTGTELGYEQFLTLLCAEMQYQDPLEPTSNTEYVAQLASFSQLEATLAMKESTTAMQEFIQSSLSSTQLTVESNMANSLVGKCVILQVTDEDGEVSWVDGKVDYVMFDDDGNPMLSVNDGVYPLSSLDTIADADYYEAAGLAKTLESMLQQLPDVEELDATYEMAVSQIRELYDGMTSYQQGFVDSANLDTLVAYEQKIAELKTAGEGTETVEQTETDDMDPAETDTV